MKLLKEIFKIDNHPNTDSPIEEILYEKFRDFGFKPEVQYEETPFFIDLSFPEIKLAIEADGRQWHSSPEQKKRDAFRENILKQRGWMVERFTGSFIYRNSDFIVAKIALKYFEEKLTKSQRENAVSSIVRFLTTDRHQRDINLAFQISEEYLKENPILK